MHEVTHIPTNPLYLTTYNQVSHWHAKATREQKHKQVFTLDVYLLGK